MEQCVTNSEVQFTDSQLAQARWAIYGAFILNGGSWGTFIPRLPAVKDMFELSNSELGLTLLAAPVGILIAMRPVGRIVARLGSARALAIATAFLAAGFFVLGFLFNFAFFVGVMFYLGFALAFQDIAMNSHAATIEKVMGKSLMNGFHARFSLGALGGAVLGGVLAQQDFNLKFQMMIVGVIGFATIPWLRRVLLPSSLDAHEKSTDPDQPKERPHIFYYLGVLGFFASVCEGSAGDWGAILLTDEWNAVPFVAAIPFIMFSATMVLGRFTGDRITDKFSREWVVRWGGLVAGFGLLTGLLIGRPLGISIGWAMLGLGVSIAIPSVFSAASSIASHRFVGHIAPSQAVAIVGGVSYAGFLVGAPMIGFVADVIGLRWAMMIPAFLAIAMGLSAKLVRD